MTESPKLPLSLPLGKMSTFGGQDDTGMLLTEGLGLWEHKEADHRPDLFNPRSKDLSIGTSKRLRSDALYFAYRYPKDWNVTHRKELQSIGWILRNPQNNVCVLASLVDYGPNEDTSRFYDLSPMASKLLGVQTNQTIEAYRMIL